MLKALYETFLQERRFLKNCSPKTLRSYGQAWNAFESVLAPVKTADEIRAAIKAGIVEKMNAGKMRPSGINVYLRALNAFLRWGSLEEHFNPPLKGLPLLKTPTKVVPTLKRSRSSAPCSVQTEIPQGTQGSCDGNVDPGYRNAAQ